MQISLSGLRPDRRQRRAVGGWLLGLAAMVLVMVVLGGLTRLTGSGLSMVAWKPLSVLPPLDAADWQAAFVAYRDSPQYRLVNAGMDLAGFKGIFWLEYLHRLWGRIIGLAFLLPFALFLARGWLSRRDAPRLFLLFLLGGAQGALGWFMVKSGLADQPEVSHLRLAAHLLTALLLYAALLWSGLDYLAARPPALPIPRRLRRGLGLLLGLLALTIPAGALVAGLHAGLIYNSFPLMGGRWIPAEVWDQAPAWRNLWDNHALVQFDHRLLALLSWSTALVVWRLSLRVPLPPPSRLAFGLLPALATAQAALGIATLLLAVPLPLAATHQAGAFLLFGVALWARHGLRPRP